MADRIKGITIEIDGNVSPLKKALSDVDKSLKSTQSQLRDVDKLLKVDPSNIELLTQKQNLLKDATEDTKKRLETLNEALKQTPPGEQYNSLQREIIATQQNLTKLEKEQDSTAAAMQKANGVVDEQGNALQDTSNEMQKAEKQTTTFGEVLKANLTSELIVNGIKAIGNAVKEVSKAFASAVTDSAAWADELKALSDVTGISTTRLQELEYASDFIDVDVDTITGSMQKMIRNMQNANEGSASLSESFSKLGIEITDSNGNLRDSETVFYEMIDALGQVDNETERDALAMDLLGRSAQDLNPLIKAGSDVLADLSQEAHDTGYVMDGEMLDSLGAVDDGFQRLERSGETVKKQMAIAVAPAVEQVSEALTELSNEVDWTEVFSGIGDVAASVMEFLPSVLEIARELIPVITSIFAAISPIIDQVLPIILDLFEQLSPFLVDIVQSILPVISQLLAIILPPLLEIAQAVLPIIADVLAQISPILQPLIELLSPILDILVLLITPLTELLELILPPLCEFIKFLAETIGTVLKPVFEAIGWVLEKIVIPAFRAVISVITTVANWIKEKFGVIKEWVVTTWNNVKEATVGTWNTVKNKITGFVDGIKEKIQNGVNSIKEKWDSLKEKLTAPIEKARDAIKGIVDKIKGFFENLKIKIPDIKMPHFSVEGKFSLSPLSVPKLKIDWYKKAYQDAMMFTSPTVLPTASGYKGFGDGAGAEIVIGANRLKEILGGGATTNNINVVVNGAEGQDVNQLASAVAQKIQFEISRKGRAFA